MTILLLVSKQPYSAWKAGYGFFYINIELVQCKINVLPVYAEQMFAHISFLWYDNQGTTS